MFKLPVLLIDRLFQVFSQGKQLVSFDNFSKKCELLIRGELSELENFVFAIYDIDKDGLICKEDIKLIFSYLTSSNGNNTYINPINEFSFENNELDTFFSFSESKINYQSFMVNTNQVQSEFFLYVSI